MRYIKVLGLVALFFFSMLFLVQNHASLIQGLNVEFRLFGLEYQSETMPFYLLTLLSFVLGSLLSTLYFFLERVRLTRQWKQCKKEKEELERELASARPRVFDDYAAPETPDVQN